MKNKQLNSKDLLMNKKEELIWRVSDGDPLTALTAGLHIIVFDKQNNKLQLII